MIPERIKIPPGSTNCAKPASRRRTITGARMFARTSGARSSEKFFCNISATEPRPASIFSETPLAWAFSRVALTDKGSISTARARTAPNLTAAMDRMPDPHPTSMTGSFSLTRFSSRAMHNWVVGCVPVPNAMLGSIRTAMRSSVSRLSQAGRIINF